MTRTTGWMLVAGIALAALLLAGCGGTETAATGPGMLFVSVENNNTGNEAVAIFEMASALSGDTTPDRYLEGAQTGFQALPNIGNHVADADNDLYLADTGADAIFIFSPATSVTGNVAPSRKLEGTNVPLTDPRGIAVDTSLDILYVADSWNNDIYVWDNAATVDGDVGPDRTLAGIPVPKDIALDQANDRLYVCANNGAEIRVYNSASTRNGAVTADRTISGADTQFNSAWGIELDLSRDRLYVANRNTNAILAFNNVGTMDGNVAPLNDVSGVATGIFYSMDIALDRERDHIYHVNDWGDTVRVWHNASGADGNLAPNRTISNSAGLLDKSRALSFISQ